jgi:hypothetical protein
MSSHPGEIETALCAALSEFLSRVAEVRPWLDLYALSTDTPSASVVSVADSLDVLQNQLIGALQAMAHRGELGADDAET